MTRDLDPPAALIQRLAPILPIGLALLIFAWGIGTIPFHSKGEPREGLVVWNMVHDGNWILPLRNGSEIPSKPPLFHWLGALTSLASGATTEGTIRAPSVALGILGIALTYLAGARAWGRRAGLMASMILVTSFEWVRAATSARVDMTLAFFMLAAFVLIWEVDRARGGTSRVVAVAVALLLALATLAKGPVGTILPMITVCAYMLVRRDLRLAHKLHPLAGLAVVIVVAGSWYGLAIWQGGEPFMARVRTAVGTESPLYFFRVLDYGAVYYARRNIPALPHVQPPNSTGPIFILMRRAEWRSLPPSVRTGLRVVDRSRTGGPKGDRRLLLVRAERPAAERLAARTATHDADGQRHHHTAERGDARAAEL